MKTFITGMGAICPLGDSAQRIWEAIFEEKTCLAQGLGKFAGESLVPSLAFIAAQEAMREAGWGNLNSQDGLILATTTGEIRHWEAGLMNSFKSENFANFANDGGVTTPGKSLDKLKRLLNFEGPSALIASACSASTQALALAAMWIASGRVKRCLVGGSEVLTQLSVEGFRCLGLLSEELPHPFATNRAGLNLGEGAAFFCLESTRSENSRAWLRGYAMNSDAYHLTAPHPEGRGTQKVFEQIFKMSNLTANEIDWVHAHGTASPSNDRAEGAAIKSIFGNRVPVTSTKAYHGHTLGASGALESVICLKALEHQTLVKTLGCDKPDLDLGINLQLRNEKSKIKNILKNSLGFGGVNAALIFSTEVGL